jgi:hypothetical protein
MSFYTEEVTMYYLVRCRIEDEFAITVMVANWRNVRRLMRRSEVLGVTKTFDRLPKWFGPAMHKKIVKHFRRAKKTLPWQR